MNGKRAKELRRQTGTTRAREYTVTLSATRKDARVVPAVGAIAWCLLQVTTPAVLLRKNKDGSPRANYLAAKRRDLTTRR